MKKWLNLLKRKTKIRQANKPSFPLKIEKYIKEKLQRIKLLNDFISSVDLKTYKEWELNDEKKLPLAIIEWLLNDPLKYTFIGLLLTYSFTHQNQFIGIWIGFSIGLWLLFRVIRVIKRGD